MLKGIDDMDPLMNVPLRYFSDACSAASNGEHKLQSNIPGQAEGRLTSEKWHLFVLHMLVP